MTERGMAHSDGAPACPFVAFEDDRDERSDRPDHRHRCYAEVHPAPRAIAHQEAYCLSSAFAVCPTFQDWAHREAARTRAAGTAAVSPPAAAVVASEPNSRPDREATRPPDPAEDAGQRWAEPAAEWQGPRPTEREELPGVVPPRRNPPRDWAAPPPWASTAAGAAASGAAAAGAATGATGAGGGAGQQPPYGGDPGARGLAGSSADRVASGEAFVHERGQGPEHGEPAPPMDTRQPPPPAERAQPADAELAGLVGARPPDRGTYPAPTSGGAPREQRYGPSWEEPRRYEAYPEIKSRAALPGLPRLGVMAAALGIAALALFFLPSLLDLFGGGSGGTAGDETPNPSGAIESVVPSPTVPPAPTPQVYIVKSGDTMSKIAKQFDVSIDDLIEANKDTITNPDRISIGDQVIIPVPESDDPGGGFLGESPAP